MFCHGQRTLFEGWNLNIYSVQQEEKGGFTFYLCLGREHTGFKYNEAISSVLFHIGIRYCTFSLGIHSTVNSYCVN